MKVNNKHSIKLFTFLILICLFVVPSFGSKDKDNDDWKCGKKYGKCKKDYCCSKYGWCGKSDIYCDISKGCQSKYGKCNSETPIENNEDDEDNDEDNEIAISTDGRCGENRGKCMKGYCCSKYGWCGKSDKYCKISKGCKPDYGKCNSDVKIEDSKDEPIEDNEDNEDNDEDNEIAISTDGRCGENRGKCMKGYCCSKYGWCGKSDEYCKISKGCKPDYGKCNSDVKIKDSKDEPIEDNEDNEDNDEDNEIAISTDGRCGENRGKCMKGYCCSKYGWCGKSDKYCKISKGCKPEYGKCNDKSTSNKDEKENKEKEDNGDDENWKKDFEEVDILIIDVIAEELNMTSSTVSKVYDYTDKRDKGYKKVLDNYLKNKLSEELCLNECKKVNTELKDTFKDDNDNITTLNEYSKNIFGESVFSECDV